MKKNVFASLLLAGMVLGTGQAAFAEVKPSPTTGYDIHDNINGDMKDNSATVPVNGTLGTLDNGDGNENIPDGDPRWIKVELPTAVAFSSAPGKDTEVFASEYHIKNLSGRPVKVSLSQFKAEENAADVKALTTLDFSPINGSKPINLVTGGKVTFNKEQVIADVLGVVNDKENPKPTQYDFTYKGSIEPKAIVADKNVKADNVKKQNINYKMSLKFEVLQKDGKPVIK